MATRVRRKSILLTRNVSGNITAKSKVEVYYAVEKDIAVTVTVYVFYGEWED